MGAVVSTCSPRSSPCLWLPWLLARLLSQQFLATSPDLSLALLLLLPGGLHRLPTLASLLTMWVRGRLLYLSLQETSPALSLALLLPLPGGLHRLLTKVSLLTMWARGKLLSPWPLAIFPDLSL